MIPIRVSNKKYKIKSIDELTTREFIEVSKIESLDMVKYIAYQLAIPKDKAFFAQLDPKLIAAIGKIEDVRKLPKPKGLFDYTKTIQTVGQRHQIEESNLTDYELLVYVLAVSQALSSNIDEVYKLRDKYMYMSFKDVLPAGFFFFKNLQSGSSYGVNFLKKLAGLINTVLKRNRPELKS